MKTVNKPLRQRKEKIVIFGTGFSLAMLVLYFCFSCSVSPSKNSTVRSFAERDILTTASPLLQIGMISARKFE